VREAHYNHLLLLFLSSRPSNEQKNLTEKISCCQLYAEAFTARLDQENRLAICEYLIGIQKLW
jgi:hypothetical protein